MQSLGNGRRGAAGMVGSMLALAVAVGALTTWLPNAPSNEMSEELGPTVAVGKGNARTYVRRTAGAPREVGVLLDAAVMEGLPEHASPGHGITMPDGHAMFEYTLPLPAGAGTDIRHVVLNWNPGGHEPPGVYDVKHFDFHFYTIPETERRAIVPTDPAFATKAARQPSKEEMPAGFILPPGTVVPQMGAHWLDASAPELAGKPFTTTFIVGSWDGRVIFQEPMITKAFLERRPDTTITLPQPATRSKGRFIAGSYRIQWDAAAKGYRIALIEGPSGK